MENEKIFEIDCYKISNGRFLTSPIEIIKVPNNKYIFDYPNWIKENNDFTLAQYILSLIEQVLSIRYILYKENKNLKKIIISTYLYDLFNKKNRYCRTLILLVLIWMNVLNIFGWKKLKKAYFFREKLKNLLKKKRYKKYR